MNYTFEVLPINLILDILTSILMSHSTVNNANEKFSTFSICHDKNVETLILLKSLAFLNLKLAQITELLRALWLK